MKQDSKSTTKMNRVKKLFEYFTVFEIPNKQRGYLNINMQFSKYKILSSNFKMCEVTLEQRNIGLYCRSLSTSFRSYILRGRMGRFWFLTETP